MSERGGDPNEPDAGTPLAKYFLPVEKCQHRPPYDEGATVASLAGCWLEGRQANRRLASRRYFWTSLARIACAEDLVGGAEDALG